MKDRIVNYLFLLLVLSGLLAWLIVGFSGTKNGGVIYLLSLISVHLVVTRILDIIDNGEN
ncbi:hypothetical protein N782_21630 [Pontibacillus yanchengensis Y32]|uniref:Uncharacterized protein n=1 Tax=Pontibacillus yanchengensis Y32 TaxID=1385514 RepID=A0A0A2TP66_9BACI|nr:hypothetical protein N782_21630 [Pontibacillus yanchengensis Y32]